MSWDASSHTLSVRLPEIEIAGPDVDLAAAREYGAGGVLAALTNADQPLDQANRAQRRRRLAQAGAARGADAARPRGGAAGGRAQLRDAAAVAAGFKDAKVVARFPTEGSRRSFLYRPIDPI